VASRRGKGKRKRSNPRVRWRRKYSDEERLTRLIEESIERGARELGDFFVEYLEKALKAAKQGKTSKAKHYIAKILRRGFASIIGKRRDKKGRTTLVHHIVVSGKGRIVHEGIHGARDWEPGKVQFKNRKGEDLEWEEIGEKRLGQARRKIARTRRWKRVKKR